MKRFTIAFFMLISVSASAQYYNWFQVYPTPVVARNYIQANVVNNTFFPIYCQGYVQGITFRGLRITTWVNQWIGGGRFTNIYVYNNNFVVDPFVTHNSQIFCRR